MSIDNCQNCDKRLDTDHIEYQEDGTLLCGGCLDEMEHEAIEAAFDAVYDQHGNPVAEQKAESRCTMGVGNGSGKLFVHGDYDSIKATQNIVLERDRYKALAGELAEALEHLTGPKVCWCEADTKDSRLKFHLWECNTARTALAKYEQEQEKGA
jgi:hypothetical protein